jgi:predicted restriction endonuclease
MTKHYKVYSEYFDYGTPEEIMCEACGRPAVDIHHIHGRGKGKDVIENLMALCRKYHDRATTSKNYVKPDEMQLIHNYFLQGTRKIFLK